MARFELRLERETQKAVSGRAGLMIWCSIMCGNTGDDGKISKVQELHRTEPSGLTDGGSVAHQSRHPRLNPLVENPEPFTRPVHPLVM